MCLWSSRSSNFLPWKLMQGALNFHDTYYNFRKRISQLIHIPSTSINFWENISVFSSTRKLSCVQSHEGSFLSPYPSPLCLIPGIILESATLPAISLLNPWRHWSSSTDALSYSVRYICFALVLIHWVSTQVILFTTN